jgi:16S rRNA (uracil1498-N3)-methyltransferase
MEDSMVRFFAEPSDIFDGSIVLSAEDTAHIRSLRLRPDEFFIVCDGKGFDHICRLGERVDLIGQSALGDALHAAQKSTAGKHANENHGSIALILETRPTRGEPSIACSVFIAYAKGERLDYAIQKSVELGARRIVLFSSRRCAAIPRDIPKKVTRLQRIAFETAKQCGRGLIPEVSAMDSFEETINEAAQNAALSLFLYEREEDVHIKRVLEQHFAPLREREEYAVKSVSIVTGPEGGFEPREANYAQAQGLYAVSLGPRILRCETAPVLALSAIMYHTGNL